MFRKATLWSTLLVAFGSVVWIGYLVRLSPTESSRYHTLENKREMATRWIEKGEIQQLRSKVQKDLWVTQEDSTRLHHKIASETSIVSLLPTEKGFDIVERLEDFQCWMQDKVYPSFHAPTQQLRCFQAHHGLYQYSKHQFTAAPASLSFFRLPGSDLPEHLHSLQPFLQGVASDVSFSLCGKTPQFQAQQFRATLIGKGEEKQ